VLTHFGRGWKEAILSRYSVESDTVGNREVVSEGFPPLDEGKRIEPHDIEELLSNIHELLEKKGIAVTM
jgi:hypothetical protein